MTYEEMVQRIVLEAQIGGQLQLGYELTAIVEAFIPTLFRDIGEELAADERKRTLLQRTKTITFTAGIGEVPSDALTQYMEDTTLWDPADLTKEYALIQSLTDFSAPQDLRLGYYVASGETTLLLREPNEPYSVALTAAGNRSIVVPCVPVVPASYTLSVDVAPEVAAILVRRGAQMLRGSV